MKGMTQETCLIPTPEDHVKPIAKSFSFVTECFFLTHLALDLGYRVVLDKLMRYVVVVFLFSENSMLISFIIKIVDQNKTWLVFNEFLTIRVTVVVQKLLKLLLNDWKWK